MGIWSIRAVILELDLFNQQVYVVLETSLVSFMTLRNFDKRLIDHLRFFFR